MKISVIVPCYKGEKYISGCLENLLSQSYKNLEIIVVIDGNCDRSAEIASQYPVKMIVLDENRGLSVARNIGIRESTGDYIHFMDVDDAISRDFYINMAAAVRNTGADVACSGIINEKKAYKCQIFNKEKVVSSARDDENYLGRQMGLCLEISFQKVNAGGKQPLFRGRTTD